MKVQAIALTAIVSLFLTACGGGGSDSSGGDGSEANLTPTPDEMVDGGNTPQNDPADNPDPGTPGGGSVGPQIINSFSGGNFLAGLDCPSSGLGETRFSLIETEIGLNSNTLSLVGAETGTVYTSALPEELVASVVEVTGCQIVALVDDETGTGIFSFFEIGGQQQSWNNLAEFIESPLPIGPSGTLVPVDQIIPALFFIQGVTLNGDIFANYFDSTFARRIEGPELSFDFSSHPASLFGMPFSGVSTANAISDDGSVLYTVVFTGNFDLNPTGQALLLTDLSNPEVPVTSVIDIFPSSPSTMDTAITPSGEHVLRFVSAAGGFDSFIVEGSEVTELNNSVRFFSVLKGGFNNTLPATSCGYMTVNPEDDQDVTFHVYQSLNPDEVEIAMPIGTEWAICDPISSTSAELTVWSVSPVVFSDIGEIISQGEVTISTMEISY